MAIASSPTRDKFPLSTKKVLKKTIAGTIIWTIILTIIYFLIFGIAISSGGALGNNFVIATIVYLILILLIFLFVFSYQRWYYNVYYYDLTNDFIVIRKGPITPREITIPYERVQDVYVDQDLFDRLFGLFDVHLSSATISSGMEAHIDGVEKPAADGLRTLLLQTVQQKISRARSPQVISTPTPINNLT
jgi:membrane protein YdbS with pleckstrin-like domain